jgi:hypothetical protein
LINRRDVLLYTIQGINQIKQKGGNYTIKLYVSHEQFTFMKNQKGQAFYAHCLDIPKSYTSDCFCSELLHILDRMA